MQENNITIQMQQESSPKETLSSRLSESMMSGRVTQAALAKRLCITRGSVSRWISGQVEPRLNMVNDIAYSLGINAHWLLTGEGEMLSDESKKIGEQVLRLLPLTRTEGSEPEPVSKPTNTEPALSPDYRALVLGLIGGSRLGDIFAATPLMVAGVADAELREAYLARLGALRVSIREALAAAEAALAAGDVAGARAWVERAAVLFGDSR